MGTAYSMDRRMYCYCLGPLSADIHLILGHHFRGIEPRLDMDHGASLQARSYLGQRVAAAALVSVATVATAVSVGQVAAG